MAIPRTRPFRLALLMACCAGLMPAQSRAGAAAKPPGAAAPSSSGAFAIESEMLTYTAVEKNSAAVACDVARLLYGSASTACAFAAPAHPLAPVVLVSPSSTLMADFQAWRADMATMQLLHQGARDVCGVTRGATAHIVDLTPAGQALGLVQTAVGMFGGVATRGALTGSVEDQTLLNAVARELRALRVPVLMPEADFPNALNLTAYADSPFFAAYGQLVSDRDACTQAATHKGGDTASIKQLSDEMDAFIAGFKPAASSSNATSHFAEVILADGFARALGYTATGAVPSGWHVLWLKALESGGSEWHNSNLFGHSDRLSGGSVVTFALFNPDGTVACSGNVYSMAGPMSLGEIRKLGATSPPAEPRTLVFTPHSSCSND